MCLWHPPTNGDSQTGPDSMRVTLGVGITSSPSTEIRSQFRLGYGIGRHEIGVGISCPELRPAFQNWTLPDGDETSSQAAFTIDHRYALWRYSRWSISSNSIFQIQRIKVHTENGIDPDAQIFIRAYPRLQLSAGIGLAYHFIPRVYIFQSIRYGIALGNFFTTHPIVERYRTWICADIAVGIRI
jgi:hypothetical protein